jgi:general stress protein YciG
MSLPTEITVREAGARGGRTTLERRGREFLREIAKKGGRRTAELYHDLLAEFGKRGGRPRRPTLNKSEGEEDH